MPTIDEYAVQATRQIGRHYGRIAAWADYISRRESPSCEEFLKEHWRRFPATDPTGRAIIEGEATEIDGLLE